jgi:hypothetical protein
MPDFNYWLFGFGGEDESIVYFNRYSSYSAAMSDARLVKFKEPTLTVFVELLPAWQDHPALDHAPDEYQMLRRS